MPRGRNLAAVERVNAVRPLLHLSPSGHQIEQEFGACIKLLSHSATYSFNQLPLKQSPGGAATGPILHGKLRTGEVVEMHETTLMPGQMPHPAHKHVHTEFMLVREGAVEFTANAKPERLGPGAVAYAASGEMHGLKNVGSAPANYFALAIGTEPNNT